MLLTTSRLAVQTARLPRTLSYSRHLIGSSGHHASPSIATVLQNERAFSLSAGNFAPTTRLSLFRKLTKMLGIGSHLDTATTSTPRVPADTAAVAASKEPVACKMAAPRPHDSVPAKNVDITAPASAKVETTKNPAKPSLSSPDTPATIPALTKHKCAACSQSFTSLGNLTRHLSSEKHAKNAALFKAMEAGAEAKKARGKEAGTCPKNAKTLPAQADDASTGKKKEPRYLCIACNRSFASQEALNAHIWNSSKHVGERGRSH